MSATLPRRRVVIVDARSRTEHPLDAILQSVAAVHDIELVAEIYRTTEVISAVAPGAVLIHAGVERRTGERALGPLVAALCKHHWPDLPQLLYTGTLSAHYESELAQLGVTAPVLFDRRLLTSAESILADLVEHTVASGALRQLPAVAGGDALRPRIRRGFLIDRFVEQMELALVRASLREHPDRTKSAWAVGLPLETLLGHLRRHSLELPRGHRPDSLRGRSLLWCSSHAPPACVASACDEADLFVRVVRPGCLHPRSVACRSTLAAVLQPIDAGSAFDAWLLHRSGRPFLLLGTPAAEVRLLLEELRVPVWSGPCSGPIPRPLLEAGRCAANLYQDEELDLRLAFRPDGLAAWPIDIGELRRRVDGRILRFARETEGSNAAAAEAVGLEARTFRRRLSASRRH